MLSIFWTRLHTLPLSHPAQWAWFVMMFGALMFPFDLGALACAVNLTSLSQRTPRQHCECSAMQRGGEGGGGTPDLLHSRTCAALFLAVPHTWAMLLPCSHCDAPLASTRGTRRHDLPESVLHRTDLSQEVLTTKCRVASVRKRGAIMKDMAPSYSRCVPKTRG